jgi:hypothetical protein
MSGHAAAVGADDMHVRLRARTMRTIFNDTMARSQ